MWNKKIEGFIWGEFYCFDTENNLLSPNKAVNRFIGFNFISNSTIYYS